MKLCTIIGARPQFIKAATVSRIISTLPQVEEIIIHSGQHYDANMSEAFFKELNIPTPKYNLEIGSGSHGKQTGQMLMAIEEVLIKEKPDWVLIYGDTNTTLAGALAAAKIHIPIAHVEAGLRSFNKKMPEEINRVMADHLSNLLFAPTTQSVIQLQKEGIDEKSVFLVGDVMYDAVQYYTKSYSPAYLADQFHLSPKSYCLVTLHRAENTDSLGRLNNICEALLELSQTRGVVLPLHPRTRNILKETSWLKRLEEQIKILEPISYLEMLALEKEAAFVITDSGGVQKEAYFCGVPCITLRNETEWVELVDCGWNRLVSPDKPFSLVDIITQYQKPAIRPDFYGDGNAATKILQTILNNTPELTV